MRTTLNINEHLLGEAKLIAAREHRTIGSVVEEAIRRFIEDQAARPRPDTYELPKFRPDNPGLRPGVDLDDKELMADLLGDNEFPGRP